MARTNKDKRQLEFDICWPGIPTSISWCSARAAAPPVTASTFPVTSPPILTIIAEYFHNGGGYDSDEISAFADLATAGIDAYDSIGSTTLLDKATTLANAGYGKFTPGTDYAYLKLSQKDPFGWLYVTPAASAIDNLSLRLRGTVLAGGEGDEFGEKTAQWKLELTAKVYF